MWWGRGDGVSGVGRVVVGVTVWGGDSGDGVGDVGWGSG